MINVYIQLFIYESIHFGQLFALDMKGGEYIGLPFALDVKGGEYLCVSCYLQQFLQLAVINTNMVAIKSKGGDCWHYDACVVLDGNPLVAKQLTCIWYRDEST